MFSSLINDVDSADAGLSRDHPRIHFAQILGMVRRHSKTIRKRHQDNVKEGKKTDGKGRQCHMYSYTCKLPFMIYTEDRGGVSQIV